MSETRINKQLGTKWFTYYTKVRPILACVAVLPNLVDFLKYINVYFNNVFLLLHFAVAMAQPILAVMVMIKSDDDYAELVRFVKAVLIFDTITMPFQAGVEYYIKNGSEIIPTCVIVVFIAILSYFLWYRLNIKYFERRIIYSYNNYAIPTPPRVTVCKSCGFQDTVPFEVCPKCGDYVLTKKTQPMVANNAISVNATSASNSATVYFCRRCGTKLFGDSNFCHKCGTEIVKE